jgi:hypothetical protein
LNTQIESTERLSSPSVVSAFSSSFFARPGNDKTRLFVSSSHSKFSLLSLDAQSEFFSRFVSSLVETIESTTNLDFPLPLFSLARLFKHVAREVTSAHAQMVVEHVLEMEKKKKKRREGEVKAKK